MDWKVIDLQEPAGPGGDAPRAYREILRVPSMSAGVYELRARCIDGQSPHREDELYFVLRGEATFTASGQRRKVKTGSLIYVRAGVEHRFEEIVEDLRLLVVFSPPES